MVELEMQLASVKQEQNCIMARQNCRPEESCTQWTNTLCQIAGKAFSNYEQLICQRAASIELALEAKALESGPAFESNDSLDDMALRLWQVASEHYMELEKRIVELECRTVVLLRRSNTVKSCDEMLNASTNSIVWLSSLTGHFASTQFQACQQHLEQLEKDVLQLELHVLGESNHQPLPISRV